MKTVEAPKKKFVNIPKERNCRNLQSKRNKIVIKVENN